MTTTEPQCPAHAKVGALFLEMNRKETWTITAIRHEPTSHRSLWYADVVRHDGRTAVFRITKDTMHAVGYRMDLRPMTGTCKVCGCDSERACPGGCWWAAPDVCTNCKGKPVPKEGKQCPSETRNDGAKQKPRKASRKSSSNARSKNRKSSR